MKRTNVRHATRALIAVCLLSVVAKAGVGQQPSPSGAVAATPQAAVDLVTKMYTVNAVAKVGAKGKPLPKNGTWSVRGVAAEERVAACDLEGATCREVVYRAGEPEMVCTWTVLFAAEAPLGRVVWDNEAAGSTMVRIFATDSKEQPVILKKVTPETPPIAKVAHIGGTVVLRITVDSQGKTAGLEVVTATNPMFNNYAMDAVRKWVWAPYVLDGRARAFLTTFVVNFYRN